MIAQRICDRCSAPAVALVGYPGGGEPLAACQDCYGPLVVALATVAVANGWDRA
uniref:Uncharacterized protein n=1 Tax=uncultured prokaryote TaxID=198431 RepID=A0A0H5Q544_9ZZZZ|nr:hypothetical protein [uncultured prokaryote]